MLKKILAIVLFSVLLVLPLTSCGFEGSKGFTYRSNEDGTCVLTGAGTNKDKDVVIPEKSPDGDIVVAIGNGAFYKNLNIETVTIPGTVKTIESGAFALAQLLTTVTFTGDGLETIESSAFEACYNLTEITIPKTVKTIGDHAFHLCTVLKKVSVLSLSVEIGTETFADCKKLESIDLGGATKIGNGAFARCPALGTICLPDTVEQLGKFVFAECTVLEEVTLSNRLKEIDDWTFENCVSLKNIVIPNGVESINYYAFVGCENLTSVTLPSSLVLIDEFAFSKCDSIQTVAIDRNPNLEILKGNESLGLE